MEKQTNNQEPDYGMEARIWSLIDGMAEEPERSEISRLVAENSLWKHKYQELLSVHESLNLLELEEPSLRFTRNVMEEISRQMHPATRQYINKRVIWGIGLFFLTMIIGFLVYGIAQINWTTGSADSSAIGIDFNKIDFSPVFSNTLVNVFMMLNVVLGLVLLDRILSGKRKLREHL
jgi:hypothetical protein